MRESDSKSASFLGVTTGVERNSLRVEYDSASTFLSSTNDEHYLERFLTNSVLEWTSVFVIAWKIHLHVGHVLLD